MQLEDRSGAGGRPGASRSHKNLLGKKLGKEHT
ncbi:MAG: hypothetical protein JWO64_909 [Hyphomicrobiales bacterium]|nr:hypothetical protein [Hyphomicrobiales bacterium]